MNFFRTFSIAAWALFLANSAQAQDVVDPIGSILDQVDEETAETVGATPQSVAPPVPTPPAPPPVTNPPPPAASHADSPFPYGSAPAPDTSPARADTPPPAPYASPPSAYAPSRPRVTEPVNVDDHGKTPERPLNSVELGYESRLRSSFASAQGMQGPLDGAWTLRGSSGQPIYALLLVDKGQGSLEGAWRDPRRAGAAEGSGFLSSIQRVGAQVTASFYPRPGAGVASFTLSPSAGGEWTGELVEGGTRTAVKMSRD